MIRFIYTSILLTLFGLSGCAPKPITTCGVMYLANRPSIDSRVISLESTEQTDTSAAIISGVILGETINENQHHMDTLEFAAVYLVDKKSGATFGAVADIQGYFKLYVPESSYDLTVQYITYNYLIIKDIQPKSGKVIQMDVVLGQSNASLDSTLYQISPTGEILKLAQ